MSSIRSTVLKALRRVLVPALAATPILWVAATAATNGQIQLTCPGPISASGSYYLGANSTGGAGGPRVLSGDWGPLLPIDPKTGEQVLIDLIAGMPINDIPNALDNFPLPFAVMLIHGDGQPVVFNKMVGAPFRVDADSSTTTGKGKSGSDLRIEVNTEPFPTPSMVIEVERLGNPPFAENFTLLVIPPWNAFNDEVLPDRPNLFFGFQTTDNFDEINQVYPAGGHAPETLRIEFIPGVVGGTDHDFEVLITTTGASNPISYLAGHFDGTTETGIQNALALSALADPVPADITLGFGVGNTALFQPTFQTSFDLSWEASAPAKVVFDYVENESFPIVETDFGTSLTFDQMPTSEQISFNMDTAAATATIQHTANNVIDSIELRHRRADVLTVIASATDVPTMMALTLNLSGSVDLDVNANTLDFELQAIETAGFPGTAGFLGYNLEYISVAMQNAPDLSAGYFPANNRFGATATNPGECGTCDRIDLVEIVLDDDARLDDDDNVIECDMMISTLCADLPTSWTDNPTHHIFSLVDDGQHGTAAGRLVSVRQGDYSLNAAPISESYGLDLASGAPMQAYLRTLPGSNLIPNQNIEVTCDIDVFPPGMITFDVEFPDKLAYDMSQGLDSFHCFGHINDDNFDVLGADLPPFFSWDYEPDEDLTVVAQKKKGNPNSDTAGLFVVRLWNEVSGLDMTDALFGVPLAEARARVDEVPSFVATWSDDGAGTSINFDTGVPAKSGLFLGGAQVAGSTMVDLPVLAEASPSSAHYARFIDLGAAKQLGVGIFGIDEYNYTSTEGGGKRRLSTHYVADLDRTLNLDVQTTFGGRFFPDFAINASFTLDDVPLMLDLSTDLATELDYTASDNIDSIMLDAVIDTTDNNNSNDEVHAVFVAEQLPSSVDYDLNPATGATLLMDAPMGLLSVSVSSNVDVFGSGFRLIEAALEDIPKQWEFNWNGRLLVETNPSPLGQMSARVSTSNNDGVNATRRGLFAVDGLALTGPILGGTTGAFDGTSGGCRISYTEYLQEMDARYYSSSGAPKVLSRLRHIYCESEELDLSPQVEDHVLVRGSGPDFASLQFSGFQKILVEPNAAGGHLEFEVPVPGSHPLFIGIESGGMFTTAQIDDVPDEIVIDLNIDAQKIVIVNSGSAGKIDVYQGPRLPTAGETDKALRATLDGLPPTVEITWNLDLENGFLNLMTDKRFEFRFLVQNETNRILAAIQLEDVLATWGYEFLNLEGLFECTNCPPTLPIDDDCFEFDSLFFPFPPFVTTGNVFLDFARISFNFHATPGIDGIINIYDRIGDPKILDPPEPPNPNLSCKLSGEFCLENSNCPGQTCSGGMCSLTGHGCTENANCDNPCVGGEWVPRLTFLVKGFTTADASVAISQCLGQNTCVLAIPTPVFLPCVPIPLAIGLDVDLSISSLIFDFWDQGEDPGIITGDPDYIKNDPWHLDNLAEGYNQHFDPFNAPLP